MIDSNKDYLNFERWIGRVRLFIHIYYFSLTVIDTHMTYISEGFKRDFEQFWISYEFLKVWSNYGWLEFVSSIWNS